MTDELRARCVELLESYSIPTDRAPQLEAELQCIRHDRQMVEAVPGRTDLRKALEKIDRAIKLLGEAAAQAPQWPNVAREADRMRELAETKRIALKDLGKRGDSSFDLERQVARLSAFWEACGKSTTRSVDWRGDKFGEGYVEGGQFVGFLGAALELVGPHVSPDRIAHAIRKAKVDRESRSSSP